ncbi:MAG: hypothetical protein ACI8W3_001932 [Myxococcota bacterium]|jgi:hypothetical protein
MTPATPPGDEPSAVPEGRPLGSSYARRAFAALLVFAAVPWVLLCTTTFIGLGLDQNLPGPLALVGALCAVLLPTLGLASLLGASPLAHLFSAVIWTVVLLSAMPSYFPEQRDRAARIGVEFVGQRIGAPARAALMDTGRSMLARLGAEPPRVLRAVARSQADGEKVDEVDPSESQQNSPSGGASSHPSSTSPSAAQLARDDETGATWIPYQGQGNTLIIPAHVDGPDFGEELKFVFDTGATLTTMSEDSLGLLGITIKDDAPVVKLRTASGELEARLVLVDAIWLKGEVVRWVTVAVCEFCANGSADGLLGLNVSSHFRVSIDHESEEIELQPRAGRRNRKLDIQPWLELSSVLRRWDDGRLELTIDIKNRARRGLRSTVIEVSCLNESFTVRLDPIPAHGAISQPAALPWGSECERFEVHPIAAAWQDS